MVCVYIVCMCIWYIPYILFYFFKKIVYINTIPYTINVYIREVDIYTYIYICICILYIWYSVFGTIVVSEASHFTQLHFNSFSVFYKKTTHRRKLFYTHRVQLSEMSGYYCCSWFFWRTYIYGIWYIYIFSIAGIFTTTSIRVIKRVLHCI